MNRKVVKNDGFIAYVAPVLLAGDPRLNEDNSYQMLIPGTNLIMDAAGVDESISKGQFMNDCLSFEAAEAKFRQAPGGLHYCIGYALGDYPKGHEMETTYDAAYWCRKIQWNKLTEEDKVLASDNYKICAPDMLI